MKCETGMPKVSYLENASIFGSRNSNSIPFKCIYIFTPCLVQMKATVSCSCFIQDSQLPQLGVNQTWGQIHWNVFKYKYKYFLGIQIQIQILLIANVFKYKYFWKVFQILFQILIIFRIYYYIGKRNKMMKPEFQHMLRDAFSRNENNCFNKIYINLSN